MISGSTFQHLADFVFRDIFHESFGIPMYYVDRNQHTRCLPAIPIVYTKPDNADPPHTLERSRRHLKGPYILLTGQSDKVTSHMKDLLDDDNLVMWFSQNPDLEHPKVQPLPIGLNSFAMGRELNSVVSDFERAKQWPQKTHTLLLSFAIWTNPPVRQAAWDRFCKPGLAHWVTFAAKPDGWSYTSQNPGLIKFYREKLGVHRFVLAPAGGGPDSHRVWESLYLHTIPVIPVRDTGLSPAMLRGLYRPDELPVLLVQDISEVTQELLDAVYPKLAARFRNDARPEYKWTRFAAGDALRPAYWSDRINAVRTRELQRRGMKEAPIRRRCWHAYTETRLGRFVPQNNSFAES